MSKYRLSTSSSMAADSLCCCLLGSKGHFFIVCVEMLLLNFLKCKFQCCEPHKLHSIHFNIGINLRDRCLKTWKPCWGFFSSQHGSKQLLTSISQTQSNNIPLQTFVSFKLWFIMCGSSLLSFVFALSSVPCFLYVFLPFTFHCSYRKRNEL